MSGFKSFLSGLGHVLVKIFNPTTIKVGATVADILLPQFSSLINAAAGAVINAETAAIAINQQSGSGTTKAALAIAAIENEYNAFAVANNIPRVPGDTQKFIDAVVAVLNSIPAVMAPTA
jgi:hypothetical protein